MPVSHISLTPLVFRHQCHLGELRVSWHTALTSFTSHACFGINVTQESFMRHGRVAIRVVCYAAQWVLVLATGLRYVCQCLSKGRVGCVVAGTSPFCIDNPLSSRFLHRSVSDVEIARRGDEAKFRVTLKPPRHLVPLYYSARLPERLTRLEAWLDLAGPEGTNPLRWESSRGTSWATTTALCPAPRLWSWQGLI